jgi:hypothetical protein
MVQAGKLLAQSTTTVPFAITQGEGLLQCGKVVGTGSNGPYGVLLAWMVLPLYDEGKL